jgi:hypothetical protein
VGIKAFATVTGYAEGSDSDSAYLSARVCYINDDKEEICCDNEQEVFDNEGDDFALGARDVFENIGMIRTPLYMFLRLLFIISL